MKRLGFLAVLVAVELMTASAVGGDDPEARSALAAARKRQSAAPSYVEHVIGYFPLMPGARQVISGMLSDRIKSAAVDEVRDRVAMATAKVPMAGEVTDQALSRLEKHLPDAPDPSLMVETAGPDREIGMIQHRGKVSRQVYADGLYEIIQTEDRQAIRYNLSVQIAVLRTQEVMFLTETGIAEVRTVRNTIREISSSLVQLGAIGALADATVIFDRVSELLTVVNDAKAMDHAASMLEKMSGVWQFEPTPLRPTYASKVASVELLPDETIGGASVHVYRELYNLAIPPVVVSPADDDEKPPVIPQLQRRTWVRISDGLPVRTEFSLPGGRKQTMNYEYPGKIEIVMPPGLATP